jgi:hypothetical protein
MHTPGTLNGGKALDSDAGLTLRTFRGLRTVRHGGAWAGYRAELLRFPRQQMTMVLLVARTLGFKVLLDAGAIEEWSRKDYPVDNPAIKQEQ